MGCDAIFLGSVTVHERGGHDILPSSTIRQAVCVVYTDEEAVAHAAALPPPPPDPPAEETVQP